MAKYDSLFPNNKNKPLALIDSTEKLCVNSFCMTRCDNWCTLIKQPTLRSVMLLKPAIVQKQNYVCEDCTADRAIYIKISK